MKSPGSVLIVVLGLLAILAVVGVTFVTMSNIDRRTAANFALQSQFMLAGDAAVDYVCHHLIQDLWYYDLRTQQYAYEQEGSAPGSAGLALLLTWQNTQDGRELVQNEPFDYPSARYDPWLSTSPEYVASEGLSIPANGHFSYGEIGGTHYGLTSWGTATPRPERPNNLGWPTDKEVRPYTQGNGHGVWNPETSFPFDVGLIRVSITVLDHAGMVNLNAHGRSRNSVDKQDGCPRRGYFISDVDASRVFGPTQGFNDDLLDGTAQVPGLWEQRGGRPWPYNDHLYQAVIENPGDYGDHPFTLDEEFELRRLCGTHFRSRLEDFAPNNLNSTPDTVTPARARNRASLTTVGWTSQVRPDYEDPNGNLKTVNAYLPDRAQGYTAWSPRKLDLNLDPIEDLRDAMTSGYVFDDSDEDAKKIRTQLVANIAAFRDGSDPDADPLKTRDDGGGLPPRLGAAPQPLFSKIEVSVAEQEKDDAGNTVSTTWAVKVQVISPWRGNVYGDTKGLSVNNVTLTCIPRGGTVESFNFDPAFPVQGRMPSDAASGSQWVHTAKVKVQGVDPVASLLDRIELRAGGMAIDRIDNTLLSDLSAADARHREIGRLLEKRRPQDPDFIDVVYIGKWMPEDGGSMTNFAFTATPPSGIPIRFPRSVRVTTDAKDPASFKNRILPAKGLPPYPPTTVAGEVPSFRAFARLADLNQVLCLTREDLAKPPPEGYDYFWPWVTRVADKADLSGQALLTAEEKLKFNWDDNEPTRPGDYSRMNAANVFCVGGPWLDRLDNDGDSRTDENGYGVDPADVGRGPTKIDPTDRGRFGGPELRVAGLINLNTATEDTLRTLARSFDLPETFFLDRVKAIRNQNKPIITPWQFLKGINFEDVPVGLEEAKGVVERRDLPFTLVSNIVSTRSDTFSIYGTIEYGLVQGTPPNAAFQVQRRRRFWALVDRSPCLAYPPGTLGGDEDFIRPRVLNFQWLD